MTGPEFAANHGNDSSTWTSVDFEVEQNLAEIDKLPEPVKAWKASRDAANEHAAQCRAMPKPTA